MKACYYFCMSTIKNTNEQLTAEQIAFTRYVAQGYPLTTSYRKAFPAKKALKYDTIRNNAYKLMTEKEIATEVETAKATRARLARLAEDRIEEQLTDGKPGKVTSDVAMFMYNHTNGTPVQRQQIQAQFVSVQMDLSGGEAGDVPLEVLEQLKD